MIRTTGVAAAVLIVGCTPTPSITAAEPPTVEFHQVPRTVAAPSTRPTHHRASRSRAPLPTVLLRIRSCESGSQGYATHGWAFDASYTETNPRSTASGAFQALRGTWNGWGGYRQAKDAPPAVQDAFALDLYRREGTRPWAASRSCWGSR